MPRPIELLTALLLPLAIAGGCSVPPNGELARVEPIAPQNPRAGNVYLLRGWIGVFSTGIDALADEITAAGVRATVYQDTQWSDLAGEIKTKYAAARAREPLVLVGHSYGADDVLRIARELDDAHIPVDLVVTLDPVTPPRVTHNVRRAYNLYETNPVMDVMPFLRGVALTPADEGAKNVVNVDIRADRPDLVDPGLDHFNIEKKEKIHAEVLKQILAVCPVRPGRVAPPGPRKTPPPPPRRAAPPPPPAPPAQVTSGARSGRTTAGAAQPSPGGGQ